MGLSPLACTLSVSLLNIFSTVGLIFMGFLIDRYHVSTVLLISAITSTLCVFFLWGFATTDATLYAFAILFGIFAGGYTASWTGCATEVKKANPDAAIAVIMGTMAAGRGIGCVISGPVSEALLVLPKWHAEGVYRTKFGWLILFTGVTSLLGRFGLFGDYGLRSQEGNKLDMEARSEDSEREPLLQ
jgi:MFS family permease